MPLSTAVFLCTVAFVVFCWLRAIARARDYRPLTRAVVGAAVLVVALIIPAALASSGRLDRYDPLPAPALLVVAAIVLANVVLMLVSPIGRSLASRLSLASLVGFQAFRIPVEWWLHRAFLEGRVPAVMTYAGRNFDVVSGVTGLLLGLWLAAGRPSRAVVLAWNLLGFGLLLNIVTVAILATPTPFRVFIEGPPNTLPNTFPYVWLPTFLVQAALAGHLLVFRALHLTRPRRTA